MYTLIKTTLLCIALSAISVACRAQMKVDESNLVTRLWALYGHTPAEVDAYFTANGFTVKDVAGKRPIKKYTSADNSAHYLVTTVNNTIFTLNYISHAEKDRQETLRAIKNIGFTNIHPEKADTLYTLYGKPPATERVNILISHKVDRTDYVIGFSNMLVVEKLMKTE